LLAISRLGGQQEGPVRQELIARLKKVPRRQRRILIISGFTSTYLDDVDAAHDRALGRTPIVTDVSRRGSTAVTSTTGRRGFEIVLSGSTPLPPGSANGLLAELRRRIEEIAKGKDMSAVKLVGAMHEFQLGGEIRRHGGMPAGAPPGVPLEAIRSMLAAQSGAQPHKIAPQDEMPEILDPDPILPDEDIAGDTRFQVKLWIAIAGEEQEKSSY